MTKGKDVPQWIKDRAERQKTEPDSEFFKIPEGESIVLIDENQAPEELDGKFGKRYLYAVIVEGNKLKLSVNKRLDKMIIKALMNGINPLTLIRVGQGTDTRIKIKGVE